MPGPPTSSGTLTENETWGTHTLTGDVTIPSGITLTILPGANINIPSGKKIIVQGTLIAQGTDSESITFDRSGTSNWYGIKFEDSSDDQACILEYCTIQHASYGVYCYKSSPAIMHCNIQYNQYGIYSDQGTARQEIKYNEIANSSFMGVMLSSASEVRFQYNDIHHSSFNNLRCYNLNNNTEIKDNKIHYSSSTDGVYFYTASPTLLRNYIYDHGRYGINCYDGSQPELFNGSDPGNNVVAYNSSYGIYIDNSSFPTLGGCDSDEAENSYYSNSTYDVYSLRSGIDATYCYWGGGSINVYGTIDTSDPLSSDPNQDPHTLQKKLVAESNDGSSDISTASISNEKARSHFQQGFEFERQKLYDAAVEQYNLIINQYPETVEAEMALTRIASCYYKTKRSDAIPELLNKVASEHAQSPVGGRARLQVASRLVKEGDYKSALSEYTSIIDNFAESSLAKTALFEKWHVYFDGLKDMENANSIMDHFETTYPNDELLVISKTATGEWNSEQVDQFVQRRAKKMPQEELDAESNPTNLIPKDFALFDNYPNPFNPETNIKYSLPEASHVLIEIYNTLGQKIATLLDAEKQSGYHFIKWNGRNSAGQKVGAGIYLCHMQTANFMTTQKMTLLP